MGALKSNECALKNNASMAGSVIKVRNRNATGGHKITHCTCMGLELSMWHMEGQQWDK